MDGTPLPQHVLDAVAETKVAIKGPITTPVGTGFRSVNVALRKHFDLYACVRACLSQPGDGSRSATSTPGHRVRENTEDLYAGIEFDEGAAEVEELSQLVERSGQRRPLRCQITTPLKTRSSHLESMLPWRQEIDALALRLEGHAGFDWIIAGSHYGLDHHWQTARRWAPRIAAVDDLAAVLQRRFVTQSELSGLTADYAAATRRLPPAARAALRMLREEFNCPAIEIKPRARRVLVNFGGFDAAMQTHHAMLALADFTELEVDFVMMPITRRGRKCRGIGRNTTALALAQFCQ